MVDLREEDLLRVDVVANTLDNLVVSSLELVSGMDTARDGAISVKLSLHLVSTSDAVHVSDIIVLVVDSLTVGISSLTFGGGSAVTADIISGAHAVHKVEGCVLFARRVRDTDCACVQVHHGGVATIARTTSLAVDDSLGIEADWR